MSALAGLWRLDGSPDATAGCARILAAQAIYGPHASHQWGQGDVSLGRRLFRTLPEDRYDRGCLSLEDGRRLVADARLDNRADLEVELGLDRVRARTLADTAILAEAWMRWGEACLDRLSGDYALAVWDPRHRRLILARDPFGHRPLHYHRARRMVAFASMPAGLHAIAETPRAPDEAHLADFLALRPERGSTSFFVGVERVEPGCLVAIDRGGATTTRRHYAPSIRPLHLSGSGAYAEALRERLDEAVRVRLRGAETGVGAHLSSGWDSAAVAATAARLLAATGAGVVAFTAAPRCGSGAEAPTGRHGDESVGAATVAALHDNIRHVVVRGAGASPLADLDRDIALYGRPALNPCNHLWINAILAAARGRGVGVLLTGDFGNLGLTDDGLDALPELFWAGDWRRWLGLAGATLRAGALGPLGVLATSLEPALSTAVVDTLRRLAGRPVAAARRHSALPPAAWSRLPRSRPRPAGGRAARRLAALTRLDPGAYGKGALAGHGVDVRDPLTDRRLIEFCLSVPVEELFSDGRPRALARRALADRLPSALLEAPTRGFQAADWHEGLTADRQTVALDLRRLAGVPMAARLLDVDRLVALAARWPAGGWTGHEILTDYRMALLRGLAAGRFLTRTLGVNG